MSNAVLYVITVLVWGSTWLAIEFQLGVVAPEVSIVYRYAGLRVQVMGPVPLVCVTPARRNRDFVEPVPVDQIQT